MPTILSRLQSLLKQTDRMKQRAAKGLQRTLRTIEAERKKRTADLDEAARIIMKQLADLGWAGKPAKATRGRGKAKPAKNARGRRSPADMKAEAERMVKFIKSKGSEGASGREIKAEFGPYQSVQKFVKQKTGVALKTKGQKAAMRYFA